MRPKPQRSRPPARRRSSPSPTQGKYGFVNAAGEVVIEPRYDYVDRFFEGRVAVVLGTNGASSTRSGRRSRAQFDGVMPFSEGMAGVSQGGLWAQSTPRRW